nr:unnamed protein product [Spirometra erinaceieuropaei]
MLLVEVGYFAVVPAVETSSDTLSFFLRTRGLQSHVQLKPVVTALRLLQKQETTIHTGGQTTMKRIITTNRTTENPWKIRGFEWELTSKADDRQEVEPLVSDHRPTRKRNDHTRRPDRESRKVETLHFCFVVGGSSAARQLHILTKNIFYNQKEFQREKGTTASIHFHIICDTSACTSVRVLFQSWRIEGLTAHIYNMDPYLKEVDWIPTVHYSGIYGLAKLLVPEIIPAHIQRIIFLDLDLVITCNLKGLWNYFDDFSNEEVTCVVLLHRLEEIVAHWDGPISLALYVTDKEVLLLMEYVQSVPLLNNRQDLYIHIIFREGNFYPINGLRNIAVQYATTDYVFLVDFDFIPTPRMHTYLRERVSFQISKADDSEDDNLGSRDNNIEVEKPSLKRSSPENDSRPVAYVIPAFETFYTQFLFPANKTELLNQISTGVVKPFRIDLWPAGHQATNYAHWYKSSIPYEVKWEADFEPYVVVKKSAAKFDTRFLGFGWNKVAYTMLLDALGYRFVVLPEVFVIHLPHSPSMDVYRFRNSPLFRRCLERFKVEFIKELAHNYGVRSLKYLQFRQRPNGI